MDAVDLLSGPRVFTVEKVTKVDGERPINIHLSGFPRPWRPNVTMRRLLFKLWGRDGKAYAGRRIELYNDETVTFGKVETGGVRIKALSHIGGRARTETLPIARGTFGTFTVEPLPDEPAPTPPSATADLWARMKSIPKEQAKPFLVAAVGHDLEKATDITEDEAREVLDNFDALLADFMAGGA